MKTFLFLDGDVRKLSFQLQKNITDLKVKTYRNTAKILQEMI